MREAQRFSVFVLCASLMLLVFCLFFGQFGLDSLIGVLLIVAISLAATIYTTKRCKVKKK